ncbi:hypothetical protein CPB84DRAFT_1715857 [Gymnopilus junonius]|uniref:Uncharacterized protein n=1 Tax=Gymnopilus junonius TaxID=109634 RepID=A0A9P5N9J3_GYMJU|nr:hypothetical protein CPB84DRAFT_1715857 [Gymnopilus junonius]
MGILARTEGPTFWPVAFYTLFTSFLLFLSSPCFVRTKGLGPSRYIYKTYVGVGTPQSIISRLR